MSGLSNSAFVDLLKTTVENLPNLDFQMTLKQQAYIVMNKWFEQDRIIEDGGTSITRNAILDPQANAKHVSVYDKVSHNVPTFHSQLNAPWVQYHTSYSFARQELDRNRNKHRFINLVDSRRKASMLDLANHLEDRALKTPTSATDVLFPYGLPYWINKVNASVTSVGDFIGQTIRFGDASTATSKAGIDGSTESHWRNYAATYDAFDAELVRRMRRAFFATNFKGPQTLEDITSGPLSKYRIYMGLDEITEYADLATRSNDNIGPDLDPFHNNLAFNKVIVEHMPQLDSDADDVIYGVNHNHFFPVIMQGDWLRESEPMEDVEQPSVFTVNIEGSYQYICNNVRQSGFAISKSPSA